MADQRGETTHVLGPRPLIILVASIPQSDCLDVVLPLYDRVLQLAEPMPRRLTIVAPGTRDRRLGPSVSPH
jgi:hypothetical protein